MAAKDKEKEEVWLVRKGRGLFPEFQTDLDRIEAIPHGERVRVEIKQGRSLGRLKLYWRMLAYVRNATDCAPTSENLHSALKLELGFGTPVKLSNGMKVLVPASIAFDSMSEDEFRTFFDRAAEYLSATYGFDPLGFMENAA